MGKSAPKQQVTEYRVSGLWGLCLGPIDQLVKVHIKEKLLDIPAVDTDAVIGVDQQDLFGGVKKEGGVDGTLHLYRGGEDQLLSNFFAAKFERTPTTMSGFRGVALLGLTAPIRSSDDLTGGTTLTPYNNAIREPRGGRDGFYLSANSPYVPPIWATVSRQPGDWYPEKARIPYPPESPCYVEPADGLPSNPLIFLQWGNDVDWNHGSQGNHVGSRGANITGTNITAYDYRMVGHTMMQDVLALMEDYRDAGLGDTPVTLLFGQDKVNFSTGLPIPWPEAWIEAASTKQAYSNFYKVECTPNDFTINTVGDLYLPQIKGQRLPATSQKIYEPDVIDVWQEITDMRAAGATHDVIIYLAHDETPSQRRFTHTSQDFYDEVKVLADAIKAEGVEIIMVDADDDQFVLFTTDDLPTNGWGPDGIASNGKIHSLTENSMASYPHTISWGLVSQFEIEGGTWPGFSGWLSGYEPEFPDGYAVYLALAYSPYDPSWGGDDGTADLMWSRLFPGGSVVPFDANPAHIVYECLTSETWGMGAGSALVDDTAFRAAADRLYAEGFGLSLGWFEQTKIEDFIKEVLDHIEAVLYLDPRTGKMVLKLIRADYVEGDLLTLDTSNCVVTKYGARGWAETINEIVVSYTSCETEQKEAVPPAQDLANISIQGGIVSDTREYYGVRHRGLAMSLARRDLRSAALPIRSLEVEADRSFWKLNPGDAVKVTYAEFGLSSVIFRAGEVDRGRSGSPSVKISLAEDVFSLSPGDPEDQIGSGTLWLSPVAKTPLPAVEEKLFTLPLFLVGLLDTLGAATSSEYPEVMAAIAAYTTQTGVYRYQLWGEVVDATGVPAVEELGEREFLSRAETVSVWDEEVETVLALPAGSPGDGPVAGGFVLLGDPSAEDSAEIALLKSVASGVWTIARGVMDTVPRRWPVGTPLWFISDQTPIQDNIIRAEADTPEYQVRTIAGSAVLTEAETTPVTGTLTARPWAPLRPANVTVEAAAFGSVDVSATDPFTVAWSRRNRLTEDSVLFEWDDADVTPEVGQTTNVYAETLVAGVWTVQASQTGLTGTSTTVALSVFGAAPTGRIRVTSTRDGIESLQGHIIYVTLDPGYGEGYGLNYGGA